MNRRSFIGAFAALLAVPYAALQSRSVPQFISDASNGCRFHFTPFGEWNWIDFPSDILHISDLGDNQLGIACVDGCYVLSGFPDPDNMSVRRTVWPTRKDAQN